MMLHKHIWNDQNYIKMFKIFLRKPHILEKESFKDILEVITTLMIGIGLRNI